MTRWLLDDKPFHLLATTFDAKCVWPAETLHVTEAVARAAALDRSGRRGLLLASRSPNGVPCIVTHSIVMGTPAAEYLWGHLRAREHGADQNLADHEAIALCRDQGDFVFVTMDKKAAYLAISELGAGRVVSPFDAWVGLAQRGLITPLQLRDLCERTASGSDPGVPLPRRIADFLASCEVG